MRTIKKIAEALRNHHVDRIIELKKGDQTSNYIVKEMSAYHLGCKNTAELILQTLAEYEPENE